MASTLPPVSQERDDAFDRWSLFSTNLELKNRSSCSEMPGPLGRISVMILAILSSIPSAVKAILMRNNAVLHAANVQDQCADDPSPVFSQGQWMRIGSNALAVARWLKIFLSGRNGLLAEVAESRMSW